MTLEFLTTYYYLKKKEITIHRKPFIPYRVSENKELYESPLSVIVL